MLPGKALHVAVRLYCEARVGKTNKVSISMTDMAKMGISRFSASRGVLALERAGLVFVARCAGRKPVVTILPPASTIPVHPDAMKSADTDNAITGPDKKGRDEEGPMPSCEPAESGE